MSARESRTGDAAPATEAVLREIARQLAHLRFGSVEILVHDGQAVSIERRERTRLGAAPKGAEAH